MGSRIAYASFVAFLCVLFGTAVFGLALFLSLVVGIIVGLGFLVYVFIPRCASCNSKAGFRYRYPRIDGGADRRYLDNPLLCVQCGVRQISARERAMGYTYEHETNKVTSCQYIQQLGNRRFEDCPNYPEPGEKCKKCWITAGPESASVDAPNP